MREEYARKLVPRARELRSAQPESERKVWFDFLRGHAVKFRRQVPLQGYILDFYAPALKLGIELDGLSHDTPEAQAYEAERAQQLSATGIRLIRFSNREIMNHLEAV